MVAVLTARKQLPQIPGLTHSELAGQYQGGAPQGLETFDQLSHQASETLFAQKELDSEQLQQFIARAHQLVKQEKTNA